jgi:hypothetical protein
LGTSPSVRRRKDGALPPVTSGKAPRPSLDRRVGSRVVSQDHTLLNVTIELGAPPLFNSVIDGLFL